MPVRRFDLDQRFTRFYEQRESKLHRDTDPAALRLFVRCAKLEYSVRGSSNGIERTRTSHSATEARCWQRPGFPASQHRTRR